MGSKYRGLPDIDTAPDVFETADEPEVPLRPNNDIGDHDTPKKPTAEGIDGRGLPDRRRAERAFGRVRRQDGSYQLGLPPLSRTLSSSSDDRPVRPKETPAARLRRLKAELAEVEIELANGSGPGEGSAPVGLSADNGSELRGSSGQNSVAANALPKRRSVLPPKEPVDVLGEVTKLQERLAMLDAHVAENGSGGSGQERDAWGARLDKLGEPSSSSSKLGQNEVEAGTGSSSKGPSSLWDLDRRLADLENVVGTTGEGVDQIPSPALLTTLQKHEHLLTVLTQPRHLDAISRRIKLLLVDLDRAAAASRRAGVSVTSGHPTLSSGAAGSGVASSAQGQETITLSASEYAQMSSLFTLLPRLDALLPIIPPLLARLSSLSTLHAEAADIAERLRTVDSAEKRDKEAAGDMEELLKGVSKGLEDGAGMIKGNWEAVQSRMKDLEERLARL